MKFEEALAAMREGKWVGNGGSWEYTIGTAADAQFMIQRFRNYKGVLEAPTMGQPTGIDMIRGEWVIIEPPAPVEVETVAQPEATNAQ